MDNTELILKFGWLGWKGELIDTGNWLYREFGVYIEPKKILGSFSLVFQGQILCDYYGVMGKEDVVRNILPDILKLWKCEDGRLMGPSLENYEEPNTNWT